MLSGEGTEISKKATLHVQLTKVTKRKNSRISIYIYIYIHIFIYVYIYLRRCFVGLQCAISRNFLVTRFMKEMPYLFLFTFFPFFHCRLFSPWWPLALLIFSPPLKVFFRPSNKECLLYFYLSL